MNPSTLDEFFEGRPESRRLFDALAALADSIGPTEYSVSKSQVAFRAAADEPGGPERSAQSRRASPGRIFARAWLPDAYLGEGHAPLVLTIGLRRRDPSERWKQVVEPAPGRFTHHLEITSADQLDARVEAWLREARETAVHR